MLTRLSIASRLTARVLVFLTVYAVTAFAALGARRVGIDRFEREDALSNYAGVVALIYQHF